MIDHTILGSATKLANEGPIPVLHADREIWTLGGCGNVAVNCKALGATVYVYSVVGDDASGKRAFELLDEHGILWCGATPLPAYHTTTKHRGFADSKLMFRYDEEEQTPPFTPDFQSLFKKIRFDAVIFSDYSKGVCRPERIQQVLDLCRSMSIPTIVDPKGDFRQYKGCTLLKPNREETIRFLQKYKFLEPSDHSFVPLETLHALLQEHVTPDYTCITRAKEGLSIYSSSGERVEARTQPIEVIDVTGAGDIVNAVLGYCLAVKLPIATAAISAAFLATQSVQHKGTYRLQPIDFFLLAQHIHPTKRIESWQLASLPRDTKRIVFTNGCFDLVHAGHIENLRFAKAQGDILVVAVNSDESVKRLKGEQRPLLTLEERITILESLESVDYICSFTEEEELVELVKTLHPAVLVKGDDYKGKEIPAAAYADTVVYAPLREGISTTALLARILKKV